MQYVEKFDNLPVRTRLVVTFAMIAVTFLLFELFWYSGTDQANKRIKNQIKTVDQEILSFTESQQQFNAGIFDQRNNPKRAQLIAIQQQVAQVQQELERKTLTLVKPEAMADLLKEIIDNSQKLKLISLVKQAPQALFEEQANHTVQMYRHPVEMVFQGSYQETRQFVEELENMKRKVNFESFEFSVDQYPKSTITLVVSTFSMSRKWIGG